MICRFLGQSTSSQPFINLIDLAPMDSSQQTLMWQQNQYMADSGIHSSSTTQAPSISSKHGLDHLETLDGVENVSGGPLSFNIDTSFAQPGFGPQPVPIDGMIV